MPQEGHGCCISSRLCSKPCPILRSQCSISRFFTSVYFSLSHIPKEPYVREDAGMLGADHRCSCDVLPLLQHGCFWMDSMRLYPALHFIGLIHPLLFSLILLTRDDHDHSNLKESPFISQQLVQVSGLPSENSSDFVTLDDMIATASKLHSAMVTPDGAGAIKMKREVVWTKTSLGKDSQDFETSQQPV
jgi:hypothetical protein